MGRTTQANKIKLTTSNVEENNIILQEISGQLYVNNHLVLTSNNIGDSSSITSIESDITTLQSDVSTLQGSSSSSEESSFSNSYSVILDKTNDYIGVASGSNPGLDAYSLSLWFKPSSTITSSYNGTLVGGLTNVYGGIRIGMGSGRVIEYNDGVTYIAAGDVTSVDTNWHHIALVYVDSGYTTTNGTASANGKGYKIFLDGNRVDTTLGSTTRNFALGQTTNKFKVGREGERTIYYFGGGVDELAIFGSSLSDSDVTDIYYSGVPTDLTSYSPTLWWRMGDNDSGAGTTITDQGSGSNDGELVNGPTFSSSTPS